MVAVVPREGEPDFELLSQLLRLHPNLDAVIDAIPSLLFVKSAADLKFVRINSAAREAFGVTNETVLNGDDFALFPRKDALAIRTSDLMVLESGEASQEIEERLTAKDGLRWFATKKLPITGEDGLQEFLLTFSVDITERKDMETTTEMWDQVFRYSKRGMVVGRPDGDKLELMNPAFPLMFGSTLEEMAGTPLMEIFAPASQRNVAMMLELVRQNGEHTFESECIRRDGTTFPVLVDATSVKDATGNVHHRAIRIQDTTLLKSNERELRADRSEAERANGAKSAFLSRMSHELRTPLNVILGFAQVMQLDELNPLQTESVDYILQAGRHLLALVDEALDISQIESGRMALSLESVDVSEVIREVLGLMEPLADNGGVRLVNVGPEQTVHVVADRQRLKQVLLNLVANGVNYNVRGGHVTVKCKARGSSVKISVSDSGIGIPKGGTLRLFAPFDRLGQEGGEVEGTGLGLSLSKALVEAMGGSLVAARLPEAGSVFSVSLAKAVDPDAVAASGDLSPTTGTGATGLVLYIEDNLANFRLVEQVLGRRPGIKILPAMQASIGLQLARFHVPDLIILDLHLPDMSGEETLRRLLRDPKTRSVPVVIASADADPRRVQRLLKLGARAYLTKPINIRELLETIDAILLDPEGARPLAS
ncbi:MAG: ATP-binding protein [bacterium]